MIVAARIFLSAGEASGEEYGVRLMAALGRSLPGAEFMGLGGRRMEAAGLRRVARAEDVAVMGITEIVRHIPRIYSAYRRLRRALATERPDALVLIDFPDVNLGLARQARRLQIPVIFFVSPQVWAWKRYRLRRIQRDVDRMLVIFPFEESWYRERGVAATFVGHPLAELRLPSVSREVFAAEYGLDPAKPWVGLLPGSRPREIALNLPAMLDAAGLLGPGYEYVLPLAPTLTSSQVDEVRSMLLQTGAARVTAVCDARATLHHARASVVASGTATVEAALIGKPFAVVYRLSRASYAVARRVVKVPHVAMCNLIAGERVVPELIQDAFTPGAVAAALRPLLADGAARDAMVRGLAEVRMRLHQNTSPIETVADHILSAIDGSKLIQTQPSPSL